MINILLCFAKLRKEINIANVKHVKNAPQYATEYATVEFMWNLVCIFLINLDQNFKLGVLLGQQKGLVFC